MPRFSLYADVFFARYFAMFSLLYFDATFFAFRHYAIFVGVRLRASMPIIFATPSPLFDTPLLRRCLRFSYCHAMPP